MPGQPAAKPSLNIVYQEAGARPRPSRARAPIRASGGALIAAPSSGHGERLPEGCSFPRPCMRPGWYFRPVTYARLYSAYVASMVRRRVWVLAPIEPADYAIGRGASAGHARADELSCGVAGECVIGGAMGAGAGTAFEDAGSLGTPGGLFDPLCCRPPGYTVPYGSRGRKSLRS